MADLSSYRLSQTQSHQIFTTQILPLDILPITPSPSSTPLAILTLGQTGAGKTRLSESLLSSDAFPSKPAHLIADVYKTHHPEYHNLPTRLQSPATAPDARVWLEMAARACAERKVDVLLESACRHPSDFTSLAKVFRDAGYRVYILILAVPSALSRLGILLRYYKNLPEARSRGLPLRLTPQKVHDESYSGLMDAASTIDVENLADWVGIVRRGNLLAYEAVRDVEGGFAGGVLDALKTERERPLTEWEREVVEADLKTLESFPEAQEQVEKVKELLKPVLIDEDAAEANDYPGLEALDITRIGKEVV